MSVRIKKQVSAEAPNPLLSSKPLKRKSAFVWYPEPLVPTDVRLFLQGIWKRKKSNNFTVCVCVSCVCVCVNSEFWGLESDDERRSGTFWRATVRIVVGVWVIKAVSVGGGGGEAAAVVQVLVGFAPIGCRWGSYVWKGQDQRGKLEFITNTRVRAEERKHKSTMDMMHSLHKGAVVAQNTAWDISAFLFWVNYTDCCSSYRRDWLK